MALATRRPKDVIHHSDQGSYTCIAFGKRCRDTGVRPSMGSVGDAYDDAMAESFFATLECELLDRRTFKTKPKHAWPCSSSSTASIIRAGATLRWAICHRSTTRATTRGKLIPAHATLPSCSGPSRCGLEMSRRMLT